MSRSLIASDRLGDEKIRSRCVGPKVRSGRNDFAAGRSNIGASTFDPIGAGFVISPCQSRKVQGDGVQSGLEFFGGIIGEFSEGRVREHLAGVGDCDPSTRS